MSASAPSIELDINAGLTRGNPLCASAGDITPQDYAELMQADQLYLNLRFLAPGATQGAAPLNRQLPSGFGLTCAGKPSDDLGATSVLFLANTFAELTDSAGYYYQSFLDLNRTEIADAFAAAGSAVDTLTCLADIDITTPAAGSVPALRQTYQIQVNLKRKAYTGGESDPTPATPPYPPASTVDTISARNTAVAAAIAAIPAASSITAGLIFAAGDSNIDEPQNAGVSAVTPLQVARAASLPPCAVIVVAATPTDGAVLSLVFPLWGQCLRIALCYDPSTGSDTLAVAEANAQPAINIGGSGVPGTLTITFTRQPGDQDQYNIFNLQGDSLTNGVFYASSSNLGGDVEIGATLNDTVANFGAWLNQQFGEYFATVNAASILIVNPTITMSFDDTLAGTVPQTSDPIVVTPPTPAEVATAIATLQSLIGTPVVIVDPGETASTLALYPADRHRRSQYFVRYLGTDGALQCSGPAPYPISLPGQSVSAGVSTVTVPGAEAGDTALSIPILSTATSGMLAAVTARDTVVINNFGAATTANITVTPTLA